MKPANDFAFAMLNLDSDPDCNVYYATRCPVPREKQGTVELDITFRALSFQGVFVETDRPVLTITFQLRAYGDSILRFSGSPGGRPVSDDSEMLSMDKTLRLEPLKLSEDVDFWMAVDSAGRIRMRIPKKPDPVKIWSDEQPSAWPMLEILFFPDSKTTVPLMSHDQFFPGKLDSLPLAFIKKDRRVTSTLMSLGAGPEEHFSGTGERFAKMDLSGRTLVLENTDGLGNNSRKAYKNVPFYISSAGYGLFIHSSNHGIFSLADISNRAVQTRFEDERLDAFIIGGGSPEPILRQYRQLTGFSPELPLWSYGIWMSRMTYFSSAEVEGIVDRLQLEDYPFDVIHLDTGYFRENWVCEWDFSRDRFPQADKFIEKLRGKGIRITLWQTPVIGKNNPLYDEAVGRKILPPSNQNGNVESLSDFSGQEWGGGIDFTNPEAVKWYQEKLRGLLNLGVAAIKTDFGERIRMECAYKGMSSSDLHNIYGLLYQKAAFEVSSEYPESAIIWARAGWAGAQRYPLHWGGDSSSTWDGMAAVLRGGLHLGMSGFTYWSHDIPGFHGLPEFMNSRPSEILYLRWTQFGIFSSHTRYHGASSREPWEYPGVANTIRKWWKLRYAIIPYILQEGHHCSTSGLPMIAALAFHHPDNPGVWHIDDQYYFGRDFLVAPLMNDSGIRSVYLPEGKWIDFFTEEEMSGNQWIIKQCWPQSSMPLYVRFGAVIPFYLNPVRNTSEIIHKKTELIKFDKTYQGLAESRIGDVTGFTEEDF